MTIFSMHEADVFGPIYPHPLGGGAVLPEVRP